MTQLELLECKLPPQGTQTYKILMYLKDGKRLTVAKALHDLGVYALSQRCGDLRMKFGWPIKSQPKQVGPKTIVSEYWL